MEDIIPQTRTQAHGGKENLNSLAPGLGASSNPLWDGAAGAVNRAACLSAGPEVPNVPAMIVMTVILAVIGTSRLDQGHC